MGRIRCFFIFSLFFMCVCPAFAGGLEILSANPQGEIQNMEQEGFNKIQILFSDAMVNTLDSGEDQNNIPSFIAITPVFEGRAFWNSDRMLSIVPKDSANIPFSTKYVVTVKRGTKSISGQELAQDYSFSFTTPTLKIENVNYLRADDGPGFTVIFAILFNQPVNAGDVVKHLTVHTEARPLSINDMLTAEGKAERDKREPDARKMFLEKWDRINGDISRRKIIGTHLLQTRTEKIASFVKERFQWVRDFSEEKLVLVETDSAAPAQALYRIVFDTGTRPRQGNSGPQKAMEFKINGPDSLFLVPENSNAKNTYTVSARPSLVFTNPVGAKELAANLKCLDLTDNKEIPLKEPEDRQGRYFSLETLGLVPLADHDYLIRIDPGMKALNGEMLGYPAYQSFEFTIGRAYVSFGEGEGVWESARGTMVPFYAMNVAKVEQKLASVPIDELVPILKTDITFEKMSQKEGAVREIRGFRQDKVFNAGLELKPYLNSEGKGIVWASIGLKEAFKNAPVADYWYDGSKKALIQVTDMGLTLKYSPEECFVYVTSLSTAQPVADCQVELRDMDNRVIAAGVTDERGVLKIESAPFAVSPGEYASYWSRLFVAIAKKGKDTAYIVNDWADGMEPWRFDIPYSWNLSVAQNVAGIIFTDRGVYKLGEEVHFKVILRNKIKGVMTLFDEGSEVTLEFVDPKGKVKESRSVKLSSMSSCDGLFVIPQEAALGNYEIAISFGEEQRISGSFMVAAYRKPDFKVGAELSEKEGSSALEGKVSARYLFGAPLSGGEVKYHFQGNTTYDLPKGLENLFPNENWSYRLCWYDESRSGNREVVKEGEAKLDANGELKMSFPVKAEHVPMKYSVETEVTDITRQSIAGSASAVLFPDHFVGLFQGDWSFREFSEGLKTKVIVLTKDGKIVPGADVRIELAKMVWKSSNAATGDSYYEWDSNYDFEVIESRTVKSAEGPLDVSFKIPSGGEYIVRAKVSIGGVEQSASSSWWFYGGGYTPWERRSDNKLEIVVEKAKYKPGDTAKVFIKSPWEKGRILLTTERETVRTSRTLELSSTQQMVEVPLTEDDIPNVFVSVMLFKGRSGEDENDKPAFRVGYAKITVENDRKKLNVIVSSDKEEYRPADKAKVRASVTDTGGRPVEGAEVTLWAVDVGVLNLTNYKTPDPSKSFWMERPLSVFNADSREKLISARVSVPKGEDEGGGGGMEYGRPSQIRKDFRVLAFWVGSALTNKEGYFEGEFLLPESLTAFRIMAVVHDKVSRFGCAEKEFTVSQSLLLTPAFPRFLTVGDEAYAGALLNSRLSQGGSASVRIESLTPGILLIENGEMSSEIAARGKAELRCRMKGLLPGVAKIRVTAGLLSEKDSFEMDLPVNYPLEKITKVQCGEFTKETLLTGEIPADIYDTIGEMEVTVSQNVLAELKEGYNFVIEYPYGCAEQRSSKLSVLLNSYSLGKLIGMTGDKEEKAKKVIIEGIRGLAPFQRDDGGFGVWVGDQFSQPYLTAYICHLLQRAKEEDLLPDEEMLSETMRYLQEMTEKDRKVTPENQFCWYEENAFAAKVIAEGGGNADPMISWMMENISTLPTVSLCHLWDAAVKSGKTASAKAIENVVRSRIVITGQKGYMKENIDNAYFYYWLSDDIATSVGLKSFIANTKDSDMQFRLAKFLVEKGKVQESWNTHRNALIYEALTAYARRQQEAAQKCAVSCFINDEKIFDVLLGEKNGNEVTKKVPMKELLKKTQGKFSLRLASDKSDALHYSVELRYAPVGILLSALDRGISVKRIYTSPGSTAEKTSFTAGEMAEVHLELTVPDKSFNVAVVDPLPAGFEILDSAFATTARKLKSMNPNESQGENSSDYGYDYDYYDWWWFSGFRQIEKHDDKVILFADYLAPGKHRFTYLVRATSTGEFRAASCSAEEMYDAGVNGRGQGEIVRITDGKGRQ